MTTATTDPRIPIIDTDTHVVEPPDLWTSRLPKRFGDRIPHVEWDPDTQEEAWYTGGERLGAVGAPAMAGWHEHPPYHPRRFADTDPKSWNATARAALMDDYGVQSQILYPNVAGVRRQGHRRDGRHRTAARLHPGLQRLPRRLRQRSPRPLHPRHRPAVLGPRRHPRRDRPVRGPWTQGHRVHPRPVLLRPAGAHRPALVPDVGIAQEKGLPINFHIASGDLDPFTVGHPDNGVHANYAAMGVSFFLANARTIAQLVTGGICHRFPALNFVSVESGIGWIPFALEALDWQWRNCGVHKEHPDYDLLPSEYFRRQIYGSFWFERDSRCRRWSRSAQTTSSTKPTTPTRPACPPARRATPSAPTTTCARCSAASTSQRSAKSSTTTRRASTT